MGYVVFYIGSIGILIRCYNYNGIGINIGI